MSRCVSILAAALVLLVGGSAYGQACPSETWCEYNGHWYRSTSNSSPWNDVESEAIQLGGHLVTINDGAENAWLGEKFPRSNDDTIYWIGFYQDTTDGDYLEPDHGWKWISDPDLCRWTTGSPDACYASFGSGEPNDGNPKVSENHAEFNNGSWNDRLVEAPRFGIVERDTDPTVPAVSTWGLMVMVLLLLSGGTLVMLRRKSVTA